MGVTAGIFLASILLKEMRYLVYIRYLCNRHISNREKMQQNRTQETPETRTNRRILNREKMQQNRAQETPEATATRRIFTY